MKKLFVALICIFLCFCTRGKEDKNLELRDKRITSDKPPFTLLLPDEFQWVDFSSTEYPDKNSLTRVYLFVFERNKQAEGLLIVQIADRTNPGADPIAAPPLTPDNIPRMVEKGQVKKEKSEIDYLIQFIRWNPDSSSLQPILKKGIGIPSRRALQGQILFGYGGDHAVLIKYSRDVSSFGMKVSEKEEDWSRGSMSGNEKKVCEIFQRDFMGMIDSLTFQKP
jgi:hypothetical protein